MPTDFIVVSEIRSGGVENRNSTKYNVIHGCWLVTSAKALEYIGYHVMVIRTFVADKEN